MKTQAALDRVRVALLWIAFATIAPLLLAEGRAPASDAETMNPIESVLRDDPRFAPLLASSADHRLQVVLGLIDTDPQGGHRLVQHAYRADAEYFYPASTIKLGAAVAAMEELTRLARATGLDIDETNPLTYHPLFEGETVESSDPSNLDGETITVGHEIRKLFLVSDNVAFNRLYELVGPDAINRSMHRTGLATARIVHRLSERRTAAENRMLPRIELTGDGFRHEIPARTVPAPSTPDEIVGLDIGRGYLRDGQRIEKPMSFQSKNRMSLRDLQRALCKLVRPDVDTGGDGFRLTASQRALMTDAMRQLPRQSENPIYDPREYPDNYVKFLLPGLRRIAPGSADPGPAIEIYNKIGQAYGFSIENAYVQDPARGRAFFLAAVIYTNRDGVLNDDEYEYEEEAEPFFADLGEAVARALWSGSESVSRPPSAGGR